MTDQQQRKIYVDEGEDFSKRQSYGRRVVTPVRFSTDPRDVAWVKENVPCQTACPAGTNIPAYIRMIVEERYGRSYEINRIANVLPGVLGRVCSRPCEPACRHGWPGNGEPVNICHLKRAAADLKTSGHRITEDLYTPSGKRVAIVGGGPAGLAAAHDLSILGHAVTIYERERRPGGMLYYGIPEFRLPRHVLDVEVHNTTRLGVSVQTGIAVGNGEGERRLSELRDQFDAVLLAAGCMRPSPVPLREQADRGDMVRALDGAEYGLDFLMELHRGVEKTVGERVAVIGAGFTALDCARVARRLGAKEVTIHIRTTEKYIPVQEEEIREAKREGVEIRGLRSPVALVAGEQGRLEGVRFCQNRLGGWREDGRRNAIPIEGSEFLEPCDTVLVAIGQKSVLDYLDLDLEQDRWGNVRIAEDGMTSCEGVFAAGDHVHGASTVVEAVGHGREIALKLDTWLMGRVRRRQVVKVEPVSEPMRERSEDFIPRQPIPTEGLSRRFAGLDIEVETGMDRNVAREEAKRCYLCYLKYEIDVDNCIFCRACIDVAPRDCIKLIEGVQIRDDGSYGQLDETREWDKVGAIWIDNDQCIRCGACYKVCPTHCISISKHELFMQDC
ncbi:MAG TPA: FAD-dependent oxidoreductase [Gammaproteobacteria bacterium]|nr:FAD-dependent oxidoreductase [Gammaproteobacteria bacterium]